MPVDKNLFLHDLAGVKHCYLYNNENGKPYVVAGIASIRFDFNGYGASDGDKFIFPRTGQNITQVVDEILSGKPNAASLAINWQIFGSNGHEAADLSRGVLERFTRRAPVANRHVKTVSNPRKINNPVTAEKIAVNHYCTKSREEFTSKQNRGRSDAVSKYGNDWFDFYNRNEEFDDGILRYRAARAKTYQPPDKSRAAERLLNALMVNLTPTLLPNTPQEFYRGKLETFGERAIVPARTARTVELVVPRRERHP